MKDILRLTLLYDFYSQLLTEKQRVFFEMYYLNDLSLQEIGDEFNVTRQAASDLINRTEKILEKYDLKLNLVERFQTQNKKIDEAIEFCRMKNIDNELENMLQDIKSFT